MQLDRTRIAVRERDFGDLLDLTLCVLRGEFVGIAFWLAVGIVPALALNAWLLSGLVDDLLGSGESAMIYFFLLGGLLLVEEPLVTAPLTLYLGRTMFIEPITAVGLLRDLARALQQIVVVQVLPRLLLAMCLPVAVMILAVRPHMAEIILLERTRLWGRTENEPTTLTRSRILHGPATGDVLLRFMVSSAVALVLLMGIWPTLGYLHRVVLGAEDYWLWMWRLYFPAALWLVIGLLAIVRFLGYLDLRIRQEGWELELSLRAEAARMAGTIT